MRLTLSTELHIFFIYVTQRQLERQLSEWVEWIRLEEQRKAEVQRMVLEMQRQATVDKVVEADRKMLTNG